MNVATYISRFFILHEIDTVYELSGGMITFMLDALYDSKKIRIVTCHHEQACAFATDAHARITNKPAVAMATSGPGATNLLTGIGNCFYDSVPAIFITGQVNTNEQKGDRNIRQLGFQETDIVSMAAPVTKKAIKITHESEIEAALELAFKLSMEGRPGPVLIDIPMNIQRATLGILPRKVILNTPSPNNETVIFCDALLNELSKCKKPIVLAGRGISTADARHPLAQFISSYNLPLVTSLLGLDVLETSHKNKVGFIGSYGNRWANMALGNADLIIVLGSRLDIRQTGADVASFTKDKIIFQVDIDASEINNRIKTDYSLTADLNSFFDFINREKPKTNDRFGEWHQEIEENKNKFLDTSEQPDSVGINPNAFIKRFSLLSPRAQCYIADVGSHQMWSAQSLYLYKNQRFLTSAGMGAMGYALPASVGACIALGNKPVVTINGDGGIQLNIQELQTIMRNKLPVKIVVLNNNSLGMIRQFQDSYFEGRYQSTVWGYSAPNFENIAAGYGIKAMTIHHETEIEQAISAVWEKENEPFLLQVMIDLNTNAYPKIAFGRPITDMEPLVKPTEIEGT